VNEEQRSIMASGRGFIAALDQSGGSTPGALEEYGIPKGSWSSDEEMFDLVHEMRARIITSPAFDGERIIGTILFDQTMERQIDGLGSAEYLWQRKGIVPFLKVDKGLADPEQGVRLMKPIPDLDDQLSRATGHGVFGTKMRSVIGSADPTGVAAILDQQFEVGRQILDAGLVPILEPEVDIHAPDKAQAEDLLRDGVLARLDTLPPGRRVMLKLSIPTVPDLYRPLIDDARVLRVVALSGGYPRDEADRLLAENHDLIASFSRALLEGLRADQSPEEFDRTLEAAVSAIYAASTT
jgi:fructose-bisphosphate aldolase class I